MVRKSLAAEERERLLNLWKDTDAAELWEITKEPVCFEVVDLHIGNDDMRNKKIVPVRIDVITENQIAECKRAALESLKEQGIDNTMPEIINDAVAKQVLWFACKNPKPRVAGNQVIYLPMFPTPESVGQLPSDVVTTLFNLYLRTQQKFGGIDRLVRTKADLEQFILRLVEGGKSDFLAVFNSPHLVEILLALVTEYYLHVLAKELPESSESNIANLLLGTGYSIELPAELFGDSTQPSEEKILSDKEAIDLVKKSYSDPKPIALNTKEEILEMSNRLDPKKKK